jgi:hypothetical protein
MPIQPNLRNLHATVCFGPIVLGKNYGWTPKSCQSRIYGVHVSGAKTEGTGFGPKMMGHCGERRFGVDACQGIDSGTSGRTTVIPAGTPGVGFGVPGRIRRAGDDRARSTTA